MQFLSPLTISILYKWLKLFMSRGFKLSHNINIALILVFVLSPLTLQAQSRSQDDYLTMKRDLAGILGEVHYIRTLCNGSKDQYWRNYMSDLLKHEASTKSRKSIFTKAFNRGYKFQRSRINYCNSDAARLENNLATKGRKIAESIATQYMQ